MVVGLRSKGLTMKEAINSIKKMIAETNENFTALKTEFFLNCEKSGVGEALYWHGASLVSLEIEASVMKDISNILDSEVNDHQKIKDVLKYCLALEKACRQSVYLPNGDSRLAVAVRDIQRERDRILCRDSGKISVIIDIANKALKEMQ